MRPVGVDGGVVSAHETVVTFVAAVDETLPVASRAATPRL
jgi:hypothetical protein